MHCKAEPCAIENFLRSEDEFSMSLRNVGKLPPQKSLEICMFVPVETGYESKNNFGFIRTYEGWNFNSGNNLFTTDTK